MEHISILILPILLAGVLTGTAHLLTEKTNGNDVFLRSSKVAFCTGAALVLFSTRWSQHWPNLIDGLFFLLLLSFIAGLQGFLLWKWKGIFVQRMATASIIKIYFTGSVRPDKQDRFPGFDGIRFIAAAAVIFSHSFLIAEGSEDREPLNHLLGPKNIIGLYGVFTFFMISGFLLVRSFAFDGSLLRFFFNRFLRILPGFLFCTVLSIYLLGSLSTGLSLYDYFGHTSTYMYGWNNMRCLCDSGTLPQVFMQTGETTKGVVNGSLWTLRYELLCYLVLLLIWAVFRKTTTVVIILSVMALFQVTLPDEWPALLPIGYTLPYFAMGGLMYEVNRRFGTNNRLALTAGLALLVTFFLGKQHVSFAVLGAYVVIHLGKRANFLTGFTRRVGDWSYGLYLFGWPVQQLIKEATGVSNGYKLFLYSFPLALLFSAISWYLVEKPALRLKRVFPLMKMRLQHIR